LDFSYSGIDIGTLVASPGKLLTTGLASAGIVVAVATMASRIAEGFAADQRIVEFHNALVETTAPMRDDSTFRGRVVIVGEAFPVLEDIYELGWRVTAQVRPMSSGMLAATPVQQIPRLLEGSLGDRADVIWMVLPNGEGQFIRLRPLTPDSVRR
jgi:hypothetical protein